MTRNKIEFFLGILVILLTLPSFPIDVKNVFYMLIGAVLIVFAVIAHFKRRLRAVATAPSKHGQDAVFVENK